MSNFISPEAFLFVEYNIGLLSCPHFLFVCLLLYSLNGIGWKLLSIIVHEESKSDSILEMVNSEVLHTILVSVFTFQEVETPAT